MLSRRLLRVKVVKGVYAHIQGDVKDISTSEKNLVTSIDKAYDLYLQMLALAPELVRYAEERQEIGLNKKLPTYEDLHPNRKFVENKAAALLAECEELQEYCKRHKLGWKYGDNFVRTLYNALLEEEFFVKYMNAEEQSFESDVALLQDIYMNMLEENDALEELLEEQSIFWTDDLGYILTMVARTLATLKEKSHKVKLLPKFKSEDDLDFAKTLLRNSIIHYSEHHELIDNFSKNWDVERVALMDKIILDVAISEAESFSSIPLKVTLNEYIDIAKFYSTQSSSVYINGVLDKVTTSLMESGKIVKFGRGLL